LVMAHHCMGTFNRSLLLDSHTGLKYILKVHFLPFKSPSFVV